jgi:hypothetical protein
MPSLHSHVNKLAALPPLDSVTTHPQHLLTPRHAGNKALASASPKFRKCRKLSGGVEDLQFQWGAGGKGAVNACEGRLATLFRLKKKIPDFLKPPCL